jgi:hypothetical protein
MASAVQTLGATVVDRPQTVAAVWRPSLGLGTCWRKASRVPARPCSHSLTRPRSAPSLSHAHRAELADNWAPPPSSASFARHPQSATAHLLVLAASQCHPWVTIRAEVKLSTSIAAAMATFSHHRVTSHVAGPPLAAFPYSRVCIVFAVVCRS